ncbi:MAG: hypothetical protein ACI8T1_002526 [Verrucomicrobiales bacterium]|jgi:hypothetical protein
MRGAEPPRSTTVDFESVIKWYESHCNDEWEHQYGVKLETLDNPGWILTVDLIHTDLQGREMSELTEGCSPDGHPVSPLWIHCAVTNNQFRAACDPTQIARLFEEFQKFAGTPSTG